MDNAIEKMRLYYERSGRNFVQELEWFLANGVVWSSPSVFFMMNAVNKDKFKEWDNHAGKESGLMEGRVNAWHMRAASAAVLNGDMLGVMFRHMPFRLPWIGFGRRFEREVRWYNTERVANLCGVESFG